MHERIVRVTGPDLNAAKTSLTAAGFTVAGPTSYSVGKKQQVPPPSPSLSVHIGGDQPLNPEEALDSVRAALPPEEGYEASTGMS